MFSHVEERKLLGQIPCDELCMWLKVCLHQLSLEEPNIVPLNNITAVLNRDSSSRNATSSVLYASIQGLGPAWPPAFNMSHSIIRSWFNHQKIIGVRISCYPDMFTIWPWAIAWASKNVCYIGNQVYAFDTFVILEYVSLRSRVLNIRPASKTSANGNVKKCVILFLWFTLATLNEH